LTSGADSVPPLFADWGEKRMRRTILLADDSPTIRRLVTQTFADANYKIVEVSNGDAAIKTLDELRPSLVLTDIYMPGKNGYEVCAYIRNHPTLNATPVILLVGAFDAFDDETAKRSGATANIKKPFEPGALIELVASVLSPQAEESSEPEPEPLPERQPERVPAAAPVASTQEHTPPAANEDDILGLEAIFKEEPKAAPPTAAISDDDLERIADRVIQKLSTQVIENIAWDIVPDITEKIVREELKRSR
jgi:CheY-like chemotaxis protein